MQLCDTVTHNCLGVFCRRLFAGEIRYSEQQISLLFMASNYSTTASVVLTVNGNQAQKMMKTLQGDAQKLEKQIAKASVAGDKATMKKLQRELNATNRMIEQLKSSSASMDYVLRHLDSASPKELNRTLSQLQRQLNKIQRGTSAWDAHVAKIKAVKAELQRVNATMATQQSLWDRMNIWLNNCQTALLGIGAAITGLIMAGRKAVNKFAEMDEQLANTRKYTGMQEENVQKLNDAFKRLDTRTPREKLNELAQEAGRLGKNTLESVQGYTEAADIINVALVDLGEGATQTIAKLTNIFGVEQMLGTRDAMLAVGSTVNVLSQNCTASKPYLVEFAQRMAGIGSQAGLTIPQVLAFGAVLDANGQKVEMSATAIQKVIMNLANKSKEFAKTVGLDAEKLNETLKNSAKDGLLMFLEALQKMGQSVGFNNATMTLAPAFKDMGLDAARVSQVLSTLAMHLDEVKWQMGEADKAFKEATSATREYEIFNNTAQASIDKAKKRVGELAIELGEKLYPIMKHIYTSSGVFLRVLNIMVDFLIKYSSELLVAASTLAAYTVAVKYAAIEAALMTAAEKAVAAAVAAKNIVMSTATAGLYLLKAAYFAVTGATYQSARAMVVFNNAIKANPIGLALGLITAAVGVISAYIGKQREAAAAEREHQRQLQELISKRKEFVDQSRDLSEKTTQYAFKEKKTLEDIYAAATNEKLSKEERIKAAQKLQSMYPEYFKSLSTEAIMVGEASGKYMELSNNIVKAARARAAAEKIVENEKLKLDIELENSQQTAKRDKAVEDEENAMGRAMSAERVLQKNTGKYTDEARQKMKAAGAMKRQAEEEQAAALEIAAAADLVIAENNDKLKDLEESNKFLTEQYQVSAEQINKLRGTGQVPEGAVGYTTKEEGSEVDKRFKAALDRLKAQRIYDNMQSLKLADQGLIDHIEYNKRKLDSDMQYYNDAIALYKEYGKQETEDYAQLMQQRYDARRDSEQRMTNAFVAEEKRRLEIEIQDAEMEYAKNKKHTLNDELQHEKELLKLKVNSISILQSLYESSSEEYAELEKQREDLLYNYRLNLEKKLSAQVETLRKELGAAAMSDAESNLKKLEKKINEIQDMLKASPNLWKEFEGSLVRLNVERMYAEDMKDFTSGFGNEEYWTDEQRQQARAEAVKNQMQMELDLLEIAHERGELSEEQYQERLSKIRKGYTENFENELESMLGKLIKTDAMDPLTRSFVNFGEQMYLLFETLGKTGGSSWERIAAAAQAAVAVMSQCMQVYSQYAAACTELEVAQVEKKYDSMIEAAEGNTEKQQQLEKKKAKETAKIKSEAEQKNFDMQIAMAIAQTAANALSAYGALVGIAVVGPALAAAAAAMATAAGLVQVAAIRKQKQAAAAKGYSEGGFTPDGDKDKPVGVVHAGEWVASQRLTKSPKVRPFLEALDYAQRNNTIGSITAADVSRTVSAPMMLAGTTIAGAQQSIAPNVVVQQNEQYADAMIRLVERLERPFYTVNTVSGDNGIKQAQDEYDRLIKNKSPKSN